MTEAGWTREAKPTQMRAIPAMDRERFMAKVIPVPESGCWIWEGSLCGGYGSVCINGKAYRAHRVSYQMHKGEIPEGLTIDHLCRVRCCVNPDHIFPGTDTDNVRDCVRKGRLRPHGCAVRTSCRKGHPYKEGSFIIDRQGYRNCLVCRSAALTKGRA